MVLSVRTKILQSKNSSTQYITIPADLVKDSQYPFIKDEFVEIKIVLNENKLVITGINKTRPGL